MTSVSIVKEIAFPDTNLLLLLGIGAMTDWRDIVALVVRRWDLEKAQDINTIDPQLLPTAAPSRKRSATDMDLDDYDSLEESTSSPPTQDDEPHLQLGYPEIPKAKKSGKRRSLPFASYKEQPEVHATLISAKSWYHMVLVTRTPFPTETQQAIIISDAFKLAVTTGPNTVEITPDMSRTVRWDSLSGAQEGWSR